MPLKALDNRSLVQLVVDQIMTEIKTGKLKPGDSLPMISELAKTFKIGISTLREALRILETMGLVQIIPRKGVLIQPEPDTVPVGGEPNLVLRFTRSHLQDLLESWLIQIPAMVKPVCEKRTSKDLADLNRILGDIERIMEVIDHESEKAENYIAYAKQYKEFHLALGKATHNTILSQIMEGLTSHLIRHLPFPHISFTQDHSVMRASFHLDQKFLHALEIQDFEQAMQYTNQKMELMKKHIFEALFDKEQV